MIDLQQSWRMRGAPLRSTLFPKPLDTRACCAGGAAVITIVPRRRVHEGHDAASSCAHLNFIDVTTGPQIHCGGQKPRKQRGELLITVQTPGHGSRRQDVRTNVEPFAEVVELDDPALTRP